MKIPMAFLFSFFFFQSGLLFLRKTILVTDKFNGHPGGMVPLMQTLGQNIHPGKEALQ